MELGATTEFIFESLFSVFSSLLFFCQHALLFTKFREEIHFEGLGQSLGRAECDVDVAGEELGDVRARDLHPPRKLRLREPHPLHLDDAAAQKRAHKMVCRVHCAHCNIFVTRLSRATGG